jgi:hypothetical protein
VLRSYSFIGNLHKSLRFIKGFFGIKGHNYKPFKELLTNIESVYNAHAYVCRVEKNEPGMDHIGA